MRLPIVDNAERPVELDWLRLSRIAPAAVVRARLDLLRDNRDPRRLRRVRRRDDREVDHGELDAMLAGQLAAAVRVLVESGTEGSDELLDASDLSHMLEFSIGGIEYRFQVDGEPLDDALGGVLRIVSPLLDDDPRITSVEPA